MSVATAQDTRTEGATDGKAKGGGKKRLLVIVLVVLLAAGAGYWFFLRPSGSTAPVPGEVVPLEPVQVNLAQGHYLSIGIALQLTADATEVDGSKALDAVIDTFSGRRIEDLAKADTRRSLKHKLEHDLEARYDEEVMGVYYTQFVTQ